MSGWYMRETDREVAHRKMNPLPKLLYLGNASVPVGFKVGNSSVAQSTLDKKGRIILPRPLRTALGLTEGTEVTVSLERDQLVVSRLVDPNDFIRDMEGFVKEGSTLPLVDPLSLKRIWEKA
jgi:AbrB family looped-hinge helix DNA binding protein